MYQIAVICNYYKDYSEFRRMITVDSYQSESCFVNNEFTYIRVSRDTDVSGRRFDGLIELYSATQINNYSRLIQMIYMNIK